MKIKHIFTVSMLFGVLSVTAQKKIANDELPKAAVEFLDRHFNGIIIEKAKKDAEHGEKGYEVILANGFEIEFWKDGSYREVDGKGKPIPTAFIPDSIADYVKKNYPDRKITHIDYGHKDVDVDLTGDLDLEFDKSGKFLKAEKD